MDAKVSEGLEYAGTVRPCPGQSVSGDTIVIRSLDQALFVAIVDVLGHGAEAHELTHVIDAYLARYGSGDVAGVMTRLHTHLRGTRGAAVGLCVIDPVICRMDYTGVGNTAIRRFGGSESRLVSQDGVLGQNMRTPHLQTLELDPGDVIVLYTDGIRNNFALHDYPGILRHSAQDVANKIVQRFGKDHDDAACIAIRYQP